MCLYTYTAPLFCLYLDDNTLYVGAKDGMVIQMNLISQTTEHYQIHQDAVRAIKSHNNTLMTCGEDNRVIMTKLPSKKSQEYLKTDNFIQDVLIIKNTIYTAGFDGRILKKDL